MSQEIFGNIQGLSPLDKKRLLKLFSRRVLTSEIIGLDLARELCKISSDLRRKVGVIIDRAGDIVEVAIGSHQLLYIPDLGRYRIGSGRLRRLRLIVADNSTTDTTPVIPGDIFTDLEKLRLDLVGAVKMLDNRISITYAHVLPPSKSSSTLHVETLKDLNTYSSNFREFIEEIEGELTNSFKKTIETGKTPAILVGVYNSSLNEAKSSMDELSQLAETAGVQVVDTVIQRKTPDPKYMVGRGKLQEIELLCLRLGAEMIIFDGELKPGQWRLITNALELKVLDRSMLILDIFASRATSSDGRLQVELAQLKYNLPRLVEKDAGLSRLSGGIGGRGPGETKLEIGRRRSRERISFLEKRIEKLASQRALRRERRKGFEIPHVAILGYTNAGKSTLFNVMTRSDVLSEDKMFATLDPTHRRLKFPTDDKRRSVILADTVGFIRHLPEELTNAFRATLEELYEADLLVHVVDISGPEYLRQKENVDKVLEDMKLLSLPTILVGNKTDLLTPEDAEARTREIGGVPISSTKRLGLKELLKLIEEQVFIENLSRDSTDDIIEPIIDSNVF